MNKDILQNIKNKYPTLQEFGIDCMNCKVYGSDDSKEFGMCGNCCICLLTNFSYHYDKDKLGEFIKSDEVYELQKRLYYYLHKDTELMKELFSHIDTCETVVSKARTPM
jgi:hypothetical protein